MVEQDSSMQEQSPLADAQNSVKTATQAVHEAQSHPNETTSLQAENAIYRAWNSIRQAEGAIQGSWESVRQGKDLPRQKALEEAKEQLNSMQLDLDEVKKSL